VRIPHDQRPELKRLAHRTKAGHVVVQRARIIVLSARGMGTAAVALRVGCDERTVRKWKARFRADPRVVALSDARRSGRPADVPLVVRCELIKLACKRPDKGLAPFHEVWTHKALADALEVVTKWRLSVSEVGRILRFHQLRPHHVRMWLYSGDLNFHEKAARICRLYLDPPEGAQVICIDEKPMQALGRRHPAERGPDGTVRLEYEYVRNGTSCLLGAFDTRTGKVFGRVVPQRTAEETVEFMEMLAARYPEGEVHVVWDNLNTHREGPDQRWTEFNARHGGRFHFVYTPIHASWMNQVEVWFSILERRVLRYGDFDSTRELAWQVHLFIHHWNRHEAHPFRWTWRTDAVENPRTKKAA
jgi:transposase